MWHINYSEGKTTTTRLHFLSVCESIFVFCAVHISMVSYKKREKLKKDLYPSEKKWRLFGSFHAILFSLRHFIQFFYWLCNRSRKMPQRLPFGENVGRRKKSRKNFLYPASSYEKIIHHSVSIQKGFCFVNVCGWIELREEYLIKTFKDFANVGTMWNNWIGDTSWMECFHDIQMNLFFWSKVFLLYFYFLFVISWKIEFFWGKRKENKESVEFDLRIFFCEKRRNLNFFSCLWGFS